MSIPQLKPDIWRTVVDFALESCIVENDDPATQLEKQGCLANLILISKVFKDIFTPQLYKDCLVSNINKFLLLNGPLHGIDSGKPEFLSNIKTLRIYHSNTRKGASYFDLISRDISWECIGSAKSIDPQASSEWVDVATFEWEDTKLAAARFSHDPEVQSGLFKSLERICLATTGDQSWGTRPEHLFHPRATETVLPETLLRIPSVKHYCQSSLFGPLAIPNLRFKITPRPDIVTFHSPPPSPDFQMGVYYPIVLGSVNRYVSRAPHVLHMLDGEFQSTAAEFRDATREIFDLLERPEMILSYEGITTRPIEFKDSMMEGTTLEIYNFIRLEGMGTQAEGLTKLQSSLDDMAGGSIPGFWKGKVFIKAKEDCPPCSACGLNFE